MWLPADRLMDSLLLALILGASLALGEVARRLHGSRLGLASRRIAICALLASPERSEPTLSLWPRRTPGEWTTQSELVAGARLNALWAALRQRAARTHPVRAVERPARLPAASGGGRTPISPRSLPLRTGREIVNGTFTHPSPIAGLVYTGSAANRPITRLVEQRDGLTLFGRPLDALDPAAFDRLAGRLRISAVVALDEDEGRLDFLEDNPAFARPSRVGPFLVFSLARAQPMPARVAPQRWRLPVAAVGGWWMRQPASPTRRSGGRTPAPSAWKSAATTSGFSR